MALPKNKISKSRKRSRAANWKLTAPVLIECPTCHELIKSHTVCPSCGYYDKEKVVDIKQKKQD